jgi:hypothetical protein
MPQCTPTQHNNKGEKCDINIHRKLHCKFSKGSDIKIHLDPRYSVKDYGKEFFQLVYS